MLDCVDNSIIDNLIKDKDNSTDDKNEIIFYTPKEDIESLRIKFKKILLNKELYPNIYVFLERYKPYLQFRIFIDFLVELYSQIENPITITSLSDNDNYFLPILLADELINVAKYDMKLHYVMECMISQY
jgi:hypothetical protein